MSRQKEKGTRFETAVADYLKANTGLDVSRRTLEGVSDKGDIRGFRMNGQECVVECKNCASYDISGWMREAERERKNACAPYSVVVFHRNGVGITPEKMGEQAVLMPLWMLAEVAR